MMAKTKLEILRSSFIEKQGIYLTAQVIIFLILFFTSIHAQQQQFLASMVDKYMNGTVESDKFSGTILIAREGTILFSKGYGKANIELDVPMSTRIKFRLGSLSKQFTAMAVMILQERGKLKINDSVCNYVPDCPPAWTDVTIHHLLTHTSGIPELLALPDFQKTKALPSPPAQTIERFKNKTLDFKPGEKFSYSNSGYVLLAYIIERSSGEPYEDFVRKNIFEPLKMVNTGSDHNDLIIMNRATGYTRSGTNIINAPYIDMTIPTGGGSLYSTVEDLYLWDQALYSERLISKKSYEAMFTSYATADWGDQVAYGWFTGKDKANRSFMAFQGGIEGFATIIMRYPNEKTLIVVLSNFAFARVADIENDLGSILFDNKISAPKL